MNAAKDHTIVVLFSIFSAVRTILLILVELLLKTDKIE
jgi:hypothetical protein